MSFVVTETDRAFALMLLDPCTPECALDLLLFRLICCVAADERLVGCDWLIDVRAVVGEYRLVTECRELVREPRNPPLRLVFVGGFDCVGFGV